ncbi:MAG TPA: EAL domain-containing protein [Gammaproteobacteria bacterium]|nr:EAL domain-containing protein [Gammaproteobacteria bacterium]
MRFITYTAEGGQERIWATNGYPDSRWGGFAEDQFFPPRGRHRFSCFSDEGTWELSLSESGGGSSGESDAVAGLQKELQATRLRNRALFEHSPFSIQIFSSDGESIAVNKAWERLWESPPEFADHYNILQDPQLDSHGVLPYLERGFAGEFVEIPPIQYDPKKTRAGAGAPRWVRAFIYPVREGQTIKEVVLIHEDITAQRQAEEMLRKAHEEMEMRVRERTAALGREISERKLAEIALAEEKEKAEVTLRSIGEGVIVTDARGRIEAMNPVAQTLVGYSEQEALGRDLMDVLKVVNEDTLKPLPSPVVDCLRHDRVIKYTQFSLLLGCHGQHYAIDLSASPIRGRHGRKLGSVIVFRDVSAQRRTARELAYHAQHDALTGLVNRREFERRLGQMLASSREYGARHALCYLDLDQFKLVNDTVGHMAGDELLKQVTALLQEGVRERDTLARLGGDEFGVLLDNCPVDKALTIAETLVATVRDYRFVWEGRSFEVGASIGVVPITADSVDVAHALREADAACYTAKTLGRNRVHLLAGDDAPKAARKDGPLRLNALREALAGKKFSLFYQPVMPLLPQLGRIPYHEMLVRLVGAGGRMLLPGAFIPTAERFGLMADVDRWVIRRTLRWLAGRSGDGLVVGAVVNLSAGALQDDALLDVVGEGLSQNRVAPERLCFDVAETTLVHHIHHASRLFAGLHELGCRVAVDDFGGGLASFSYLKKMPVDYFKIAGTFTTGMLDSASDRAIVRAIKQVADAMGVATVAKRVENEALVKLITETGIDYVQGHAIAEPRPLAGEPA